MGVVPFPSASPPPPHPPRLLDRTAEVLRARHYSGKTVKAYLHWIRRYVRFHAPAYPRAPREPAVNTFLTHLAVREHVAASTQNQALAALLFLDEHVLEQPLDRIEGVIRARKPKRVPVVLSREEVHAALSFMEGTPRLVGMLLYGTGMRLTECLSVRVKDLDFHRREVIVRDGKGAKDRVTMMPDLLRGPLREHLRAVRSRHDQDLARGLGRVPMPEALARKYPNATASGAGSGSSRPPRITSIGRAGPGTGTICTSRWCRRRFGRRRDESTSPNRPAPTPSGTRSPPTSSRTGTTSVPSKSCSATRTCAPRRSTRAFSTEAVTASGGPLDCTTLSPQPLTTGPS